MTEICKNHLFDYSEVINTQIENWNLKDPEDPLIFKFFEKELKEFMYDRKSLHVAHGDGKDLEQIELEDHTTKVADNIHSLFILFDSREIEDVDILKQADRNIRYIFHLNYSEFPKFSIVSELQSGLLVMKFSNRVFYQGSLIDKENVEWNVSNLVVGQLKALTEKYFNKKFLFVSVEKHGQQIDDQ
jgi:hypothetical protein